MTNFHDFRSWGIKRGGKFFFIIFGGYTSLPGLLEQIDGEVLQAEQGRQASNKARHEVSSCKENSENEKMKHTIY